VSKQRNSDTLSVNFTTDLSKLPVTSSEVQLIWSHLDDMLMKVLMQEEEE
jgi:hypothetical protein